MVSSRLAKTASKSVHPFGWDFVHKQSRTDTQTHRQTDTQTNCSENITPSRFLGGVIFVEKYNYFFKSLIKKNSIKPFFSAVKEDADSK